MDRLGTLRKWEKSTTQIAHNSDPMREQMPLNAALPRVLTLICIRRW